MMMCTRLAAARKERWKGANDPFVQIILFVISFGLAMCVESNEIHSFGHFVESRGAAAPPRSRDRPSDCSSDVVTHLCDLVNRSTLCVYGRVQP